MAPSLSPDLRAQTIALHWRLAVLTRAFHRLAELARQGRLRVYPDRASPAARGAGAERRQDAADGRRAPGNFAEAPADSPFGEARTVVQGPTLPAMPTRGFGWMLGFVPAEYGPALLALLTFPEMISLIQASPSVARLLRPLCRGLGVTPPEGVFPPPRQRASRDRPEAISSKSEPGDAGDGAGLPAPPADECPSDARAITPDRARLRTHHARRQPAADAVMSPQARERWWAERRATGHVAAEVFAPMRADPPARGRCAKC